jgi:hypothetical protein
MIAMAMPSTRRIGASNPRTHTRMAGDFQAPADASSRIASGSHSFSFKGPDRATRQLSGVIFIDTALRLGPGRHLGSSLHSRCCDLSGTAGAEPRRPRPEPTGACRLVETAGRPHPPPVLGRSPRAQSRMAAPLLFRHALRQCAARQISPAVSRRSSRQILALVPHLNSETSAGARPTPSRPALPDRPEGAR